MNGVLQDAIDLHAHCGPDTRPRKMTAPELVAVARSAGMRGVLLKNHDTPTTAIAALLDSPVLRVLGGVVLNDAVGGLNPAAVETALRLGARQVWMPTHCAANERRYRGLSGGIRVTRAAAAPICALVAKHDAILGTGHLSEIEIRDVVAEARAAGVRKILINHPEIAFQSLPLAFQREIAGPDVFFERCFVRSGFNATWDSLAEAIRQTGAGQNVLATDLGQPANPDPVAGFAMMAVELSARGFSDSELRRMACENPAALAGI